MIESTAMIAQARTHLESVEPQPSAIGALWAAAFAATAAVLLAGMVIVGPGVSIEEPVIIAQP